MVHKHSDFCQQVQCVLLVTEPGISLIILPLMRILQRNLKRTTDTFLFISYITNVILFKSLCNIFIGVRIIKETSGSVASGAHCYLQMRYKMLLHFFRFSCQSIFNPNNDDFCVLLLRFSDLGQCNVIFTRSPSRMHSNEAVLRIFPAQNSCTSASCNYRDIEISYVHIARVIISTDYTNRFHFIVPPVLFASRHSR